MLNLGEPRDYLRLFFTILYLGLRFDALLSTVAVEEEKSQFGSELSLLLFAKVERERERETVCAYDSFLSIYTSYFREETLFRITTMMMMIVMMMMIAMVMMIMMTMIDVFNHRD